MDREGKLEGTVELNIQEGIDRDTLIGILDRVLDQHGCQVCGLGGLDLELRTRGAIEGFEDLPGLHNARLHPPR